MIYVLGVGGFLGKSVLSRLTRSGYLAKGITGNNVSAGLANVERVDWCSPTSLTDLILKDEPHTIINCCGTISHEDFCVQSESIFFSHFLVVRNVLKALQGCRDKTIIHMGSSVELKTSRNRDNYLVCDSQYKFFKNMASSLLLNFARNNEVNVIIFRLFTVYGKEQQPEKGRLLPDLVAAMSQGQTYVIKNRHAKRDFTHVNDLCSAIEKIIQGTRVPTGAYDFGTGVSTAVEKVVEQVLRYYPEGSIQYLAMPNSSCDNHVASRPNLMEMLAIEYTPLSAGIGFTIDP